MLKKVFQIIDITIRNPGPTAYAQCVGGWGLWGGLVTVAIAIFAVLSSGVPVFHHPSPMLA